MVAIEMGVNVWEVTRFETQNGRKMRGGGGGAKTEG